MTANTIRSLRVVQTPPDPTAPAAQAKAFALGWAYGGMGRPFDLYGNSSFCRAYAVLPLLVNTLAGSRADVGRGTDHICGDSVS